MHKGFSSIVLIIGTVILLAWSIGLLVLIHRKPFAQKAAVGLTPRVSTQQRSGPKSSGIANWQLYTGSNFHFSYPPRLKLAASAEQTNGTQVIRLQTVSDLVGFNWPDTIVIQRTPSSVVSLAALRQGLQSLGFSETNETIGRLKVFNYTGRSHLIHTPPIWVTQTLFEEGKQVYLFKYMYAANNPDKAKATLLHNMVASYTNTL